MKTIPAPPPLSETEVSLRFPQGMLGQKAEVIAIETLVRAGH
jgi:hypothetical protein